MSKVPELVVLVPGLFSPRLTMLPMAWRLKKAGYKTRLFANRYFLKTPKQNGERLAHFLQGLDAPVIHLVGHSLGGVVILNALEQNTFAADDKKFKDGKVVLIASPVRGSGAAEAFRKQRFIGWTLGKSIIDGLLQAAPATLDGRQVGLISGSKPAGLSAQFQPRRGSSDGLVTQSETELSGAKDTVCIPQSHALMLFSKLSCDLTTDFLQRSEFFRTI